MFKSHVGVPVGFGLVGCMKLGGHVGLGSGWAPCGFGIKLAQVLTEGQPKENVLSPAPPSRVSSLGVGPSLDGGQGLCAELHLPHEEVRSP